MLHADLTTSPLASYGRWSGFALLLGGAAGVIAHLLHPGMPETLHETAVYTARTVPVHTVLLLASVLLLFGLPAWYVRRSAELNRIGWISLPFLFFGLLLTETLHCMLEITVLPGMYTGLTAPEEIRAVNVEIARMYAAPPGPFLFIPGTLMTIAGAVTAFLSIRRMSRMPQSAAVLLVLYPVCGLLRTVFHASSLYAFPALLYAALAVLGWTLLKPRAYT
ncbi:hypothetical protein PM3016_5945 [Paenibacillus mucilaginosus 3016]|uniref:Uncharacterized protein n=1 Tax=Paenibacillus mucilaginosus 3016 TaxID=1116391 RepID=H6NPJ2_9BACL|nr:hypothetical protein [Paenibacillus mucilaginosus]AFC32604.1 hypothetical protein PM3016_5945 [Paenibacillus mucilaginosus 3016]WFA21079.1 hypothetical protein ERY13_29490 [Paenibacillus mucilaginosus]